MSGAIDLAVTPLHLGLGASALVEPAFTGMDWYQGYTARHAADGVEGRLVSLYTFSESWNAWECHPHGAEVVACTAGAITLHQEFPDGRSETVVLGPGQCAINPPGVWHTADVAGEATVLFITAGHGTIHRAR
jgi:mannose-6-phosphate isomerase-like protein (cupin superfamily)